MIIFPKPGHLILKRLSSLPRDRGASVIVAGGGNGKPLDYEELERWSRVGYERGMRFRQGDR